MKKDFGWENSWKETPVEVKKCKEAKHNLTVIDVGPPHGRLEHRVTCETCNYVYRYDSSD